MSLFIVCSQTLAYLLYERIIFPKYYATGDKKKYWIVSIICIFILAIAHWFIDAHLIHPLGEFNHQLPFFFYMIRVLSGVTIVFFIATSIGLIQHNSTLQEKEQRLIQENLANEVKLLKAQINPHFIFNALNNIYSLTYMKSEMAPDSILKLSEMLRYVFYDCSSDKVNLNSEVKYIENFIAFQQMKSEEKQNITLDVLSKNQSFEIAPMLFIPFIENSFKYSRIEDDEQAFVHISIEITDDELIFKSVNSVPKLGKANSGSGMGIANVRQRMNIIYEGQYTLNIQESFDNFDVELRIKH